MGLSAPDVRASALWQMLAAIEGFKLANGAEDKPAPPSLAEHEALMAKHGPTGSIKHG